MATTPRRSLRVPHTYTPKMSERKKGLFQSETQDSLTKHRQLTVLDSESESDDCDLGIMGALDSSSCDENDSNHPKTPGKTVWRSEEEMVEEDEDGIGQPGIIIPRTERIYFDPEQDNPATSTTISSGWPSVRANVSSPARSPPAPSSPAPSSPASPVPVLTSADSSDHSLEPNCKFDFKWRGFSDPQPVPEVRREPFSDIDCGPTERFDTPYAVFTAIWDRGIMEQIATQTNIYAQQLATVMLHEGTIQPKCRITKWKDINVDELLRGIYKLRIRDSLKELFKEIDILTVASQYIYSNIMYVRKNIHVFSKNNEVHNVNLRNKDKLVLPQSRLSKVSNSFIGNCVRFYNKLPQQIIELNETKFKAHIKACLIGKAYYKVNDYIVDKNAWPTKE